MPVLNLLALGLITSLAGVPASALEPALPKAGAGAPAPLKVHEGTLLTQAAREGKVELIETMIRSGDVKIDSTDPRGNTALMGRRGTRPPPGRRGTFESWRRYPRTQ